jgi:Txe/YoeB family toxin of Txe-Axe toxin-antitoxin module
MRRAFELQFEGESAKQIRRLAKSGTPSFQRGFEGLLNQLRVNPYGPAGSASKFRLKKLSTGDWSARPDYRHRVIYRVEGNVVIILEVTTREGAYKDL